MAEWDASQRRQKARAYARKRDPPLPIWMPCKDMARTTAAVGRMYKSPCFTNEFADVLGTEILAFAKWIKPSQEEKDGRRDLTDRVKALITLLWPQSTTKVCEI